MSRSNTNPESKIVTYFQTAPVAEARLVFNIVKGVIAARANEVLTVTPSSAPDAARLKYRANPNAKKRVRRTKAQMLADAATAAAVPQDQAGEPVGASTILGQ
jgi:hypothetical protein